MAKSLGSYGHDLVLLNHPLSHPRPGRFHILLDRALGSPLACLEGPWYPLHPYGVSFRAPYAPRHVL